MLYSATDEDSDEFGIERYSLQDDSETFTLVEHVNPDDTKVPQLILKRKLDREEKSNYALALTAVDKGDRSTTVELLVNVVDVNDNQPRWQGWRHVFHLDQGGTRPGRTVACRRARYRRGRRAKWPDYLQVRFARLSPLPTRLIDILKDDNAFFFAN